jgi:hypothetical protein
MVKLKVEQLRNIPIQQLVYSGSWMRIVANTKIELKHVENGAGAAAQLMSEFATRTGLAPPAQDQQRYLWTDAFAVCNFLELVPWREVACSYNCTGNHTAPSFPLWRLDLSSSNA